MKATRRERTDRVLWIVFVAAAVLNVVAALANWSDIERAGRYGWASVACIACAITFLVDIDAERLRARVAALEKRIDSR